jgi:uncharacterized protein (DUF58 family)
MPKSSSRSSTRASGPSSGSRLDDFRRCPGTRQPRRQRAAPQRHAALAGQDALHAARALPARPRVTLRSGDPLGIFHTRRRWLSGSGYVIVYPLTIEITSFAPSVSELSGGEARHRRTYQITSSVAGVREYVTGDGFNRIHWPTTARLAADGQGVRAGPDRRRVDLS